MSRRLLVLGWHNIDPTPAFPAVPGAGRRGFARQLGLLARFSHVVRLSDAVDALQAGAPLPPRAVALTFDDGYRDNVDLVLPELARWRLPATFFLVPGFLSGQVRAWWEELGWAFERASAPELRWADARYELADPARRRSAYLDVLPGLKRLDRAEREDAATALIRLLDPAGASPDAGMFLDWDGARELVAAGHEIGSHTLTHAILGRETAAAQAVELDESRDRLHTGLGQPVDVFAYPNGTARDYDATTVHAAREAGYRAAVTTTSGLASARQSPYELRRILLSPDTDLPRALRGLRWMAQDAVRARWPPRGR